MTYITKTPWMRRRTHRLALMIVSVTILIIILVTVLFMVTCNLMVQQLGTKARGIAASTAVRLETEPRQLRALIDDLEHGISEANRPFYEQCCTLFQEIIRSSDLDYLFLERPSGDSDAIYILDGHANTGDRHAIFGVRDKMSPFERDVLVSNQVTVSPLIYTPGRGRFASAYAPVRDPDTGEILALVGADISTASLRGFLRIIYGNFTLFALLLLGSTIATILLLARGSHRAFDYDPLTGLKSRAYLEDYLLRTTHPESSRSHAFSLVLLSIDRFKQINNRYGHNTGDHVVQIVADVLRAGLREPDFAARFDRDQFVLILRHADASMAAGIARRLQHLLRASPLHKGAISLVLTLSIGIAQRREGLNSIELLRLADQAMSASKHRGGDRITVASDEQPANHGCSRESEAGEP